MQLYLRLSYAYSINNPAPITTLLPVQSFLHWKNSSEKALPCGHVQNPIETDWNWYDQPGASIQLSVCKPDTL